MAPCNPRRDTQALGLYHLLLVGVRHCHAAAGPTPADGASMPSSPSAPGWLYVTRRVGEKEAVSLLR